MGYVEGDESLDVVDSEEERIARQNAAVMGEMDSMMGIG